MSAQVFADGGIRVPRCLLTAEEVEADWTALSCPNPAHVQALKAGSPGVWRHKERVSSLVTTDTNVIYPAAAPGVYRPRLKSKTFALVDNRPTFPPEPLAFGGTLLGFQAAALDALLAQSTGGLVAPCGAGKGEMLVAAVGRLGLPTLVVVASLEQADELRARVSARLGVTAGLIGGGTFDVQRVTVALVQSLDASALERLASAFEVLIVDEGHHAAAESYRAASFAIRARRRYWFSATPDREDGLTPFVVHHLGPIRATITRADLVAAGRAVDPVFFEICTSFRYAYASREDWTPMLAALASSHTRNVLVVDTVVNHGAGRVSAVLTGRVEHADVLRGMLETHGLRAFTLTSATKKGERARIIMAARAGELDVIVGTQLLDEGIDIPSLSRLFLVFPAKAEGRLVQRVGRALRVDKAKGLPMIFDFVDRHVGVLAHQARVRRGVFLRQFPQAARFGAAA